MGNLKFIGLVLIGLGILGFAIPAFTTRENKEVARVGDVELKANVDETHTIPPLLAGGVLIAGVVLVGVGVMKRT
jgi:hypothetical protein